MKLSKLTESINQAVFTGTEDPEIQRLSYDSRTSEEGSLFFALKGQNLNGIDFIESAVKAGASGIVAEVDNCGLDVPWVKVPDGRHAMSAMSDMINACPSSVMRIAGVTGTNGKTTTAFLLHHLLEKGQKRCGLLGTICYKTGSTEDPLVTHTTPESPELQSYLSEMLSNGCVAAVMEVSSHGIVQRRTDHVQFDVGIFTNLSRDHLDFHESMEQYYQAKRKLFDQVASCDTKPKRVAVINYDDDWGKKIISYNKNKKLKTLTYGLGVGADYRAADLRQTRKGTDFTLEVGRRQIRASIPFIGKFNVYNALAALVAGVGMGLNVRETVSNLADFPQIPGRLESVSEGRPFDIYVDYAHTPDALSNALLTLGELNPRRLIVIFGCGGDRDDTKRAQMGNIAATIANYAIITSDNPRSESPSQIISEIESGFEGTHYEIVEDRREAIALGVSYLLPGDILLIAGKGHETYQEVSGKRTAFDDRIVAGQMLNDRDHVFSDMVREKREQYEKEKLERDNRGQTEGEEDYRRV
ncbi:MAG: UDP-N-acetylmuramoyl-L-alanyl-D-glutamate--2,6-diaminopimelate ligase [Verrucomicrobiaceae bacterium]|nr:MAG: UDP-N-acetylmuramoyl-L-alanyl-D-glutamate--2,6-diaminopimelate ligase [Verrucomicrobiaceae bacterium]